ncbi:mandelate racemase/muconate lactonizing enzyme family protein [Saccharopolyspora mangrovi]|uniref:Mandelate racemase/muconate lactonizing enzyme family protein n=1 Tax=Saccharopolyspora mangrovi TaxID=3082379 RepID=A0ABU6AF26_9PSEU|nr:mandelate racemase/muconate lactonizing enzyme family protein [Saccharopolyspora sp. S2-29]MEB3370130.1 mandelate racemase/muconate lactonizing enzyme family protein [Saccharopolyspora sp. S2-29]
MSGRATVTEIETFPLEFVLPDGGYGASKVINAARVATIVKVTTSDGVAGWGESFGPPRLTAPFLAEQAGDLLGRPADIREDHILDRVSVGYHLSGSGLHIAAASGIDIALWDAQARTFGVPVAQLLGGRLRDRVDAYASSGYVTATRDLGEFRERMAAHADEGFTAAKIKIGISPAEDRARTAITRELMGDDGLVIVDYNSNNTRASLQRSLARIRDLDPHWVEEPLPPDDAEGWRSLRDLGLPLSGGEALYTRFGFRDPIAEQRFDIVQPDVAKCGGFTEAQAIRQLAATWNLQLSPHCWGTGVAQAATLQLLSAVPRAPFGMAGGTPLLFEFDRGFNPLRERTLATPIKPENGTVAIPDGPGLGVTIDENWLRANRLEQHSVLAQ